MAARLFGGKVAVGVAAQSLTVLIRAVKIGFRATTFGAGNLRAGEDNADRVLILDKDGDELGYLRPAEPLDMTNLGSVLHTDSIFLQAVSADDEVYCFLVEW